MRLRRSSLVVCFILVLVSASPATANHDGTPPSSISGVVTNTSGDPISSVCVTAYNHFGSWQGWADTEPDGTYTIEPLPTGTYFVSFYDCNWPTRYVGEWYSDKPNIETADPIELGGGEARSGVDAALALGGSITGRVTSSTGSPMAYACVDVYGPDSSWAGSGWTDEDGRYEVTALPEGEFKVFFTCAYPYDSEWWDDKPTIESADPVSVSLEVTTSGIDAVLVATSPPPPGAVDMAVTGLRVNNVKMRTDQTELTESGWMRTVGVEVTNRSETRSSSALLRVTVCTATDNSCRSLGETWVPAVAGGGQARYDFDWNGLGSVGDATVVATLDACFDPDESNNVARARHYVLIGGTGAGLTVLPLGYQYPGSYSEPGYCPRPIPILGASPVPASAP